MLKMGEQGMEFWDRMEKTSQGVCPDCGSRAENVLWDTMRGRRGDVKGVRLWQYTEKKCAFACYIGEHETNVTRMVNRKRG